MNTYVIIGAPGMGKSPFVRKMIDGRRCFVFDVQDEYGSNVKYPGQQPVGLTSDTTKERSRYAGTDVIQFLKLCEKKKNTVIVFEEATAFFRGAIQKDTARYLINRYHSKNVSLFIFHSVQTVPPSVFDLCNYVVLFKTLDLYDNVRRKRPELLEHFQRLKQLPDGEKAIIKLI